MKNFLTVLCTGILTYSLTYNTGITVYKRSAVTPKDNERIQKLLKNKTFLHEADIYRVEKLKMKKLKKSRDCMELT